MKRIIQIIVLFLLILGISKAAKVPPPLVSGKGSATGGGGAITWYDSTATSNSFSGIAGSFQEWDPVVVGTGGTLKKIRGRFRGGISDQTVKMAVYNSAGTVLYTNGITGTIAGSSSEAWYEIDLGSGLSLSAATYKVAVSASGGVDIKTLSGSGGDYSAIAYASFPGSSLPAPDGNLSATILVSLGFQ